MRGSPERGAILIASMWVIVVLVGLALVLGQTMRVESISTTNELSSLQAQGVEQGAIQYVLYNLASLQGQMPLAANMPCEAVQVGQGAFWILQSNDTTDDFTYCFGVTDECAKVHLNTADLNTLEMLPDMTSELAPCIIDWRTAGDTASPGGAKNDYYATLADPYTCKEAPFETVEELFLVKGADTDVMYAEDTNRNGVLAACKDGNKDGKLDRGLFPFITIYSLSPNTDANGNARVNVNGPPQIITTRNGRNIVRTYLPNQALSSLLQQKLSASRYQAVIAAMTTLLTKNPAVQFRNIFDFYNRTQMTADDFKLVADSLTTNPASPQTGMINVVTAPKEVLMCLPGLEDSDASALIAKRISLGALSSSSTSASGGAGLSNSRLSSAMSSSPLSSGLSSGLTGSSVSATADLYNPWWVVQAITPQKAAGIGGRITTRTSRYSADIVSVSGNGRSFRRCRIVVDAQKTPKIIYRQDLTHLGWPLAPEILTALRSGKTVDQLPLTSVTGRGP